MGGQKKTTRNWTAGFRLWLHLPGQAILGTYLLTHSHMNRLGISEAEGNFKGRMDGFCLEPNSSSSHSGPPWAHRRRADHKLSPPLQISQGPGQLRASIRARLFCFLLCAGCQKSMGRSPAGLWALLPYLSCRSVNSDSLSAA